MHNLNEWTADFLILVCSKAPMNNQLWVTESLSHTNCSCY